MSMTDRIKSSIEAFVRRLVSRYDYAVVYAYTVVSQNDDWSLELKPSNPKLAPPLSAVEVLWSDPATRCRVKRDARAFVMFADADPSKPFAFGFRHGDYELVSIGDDGQPIARTGELVYSGGAGTVIMIDGPSPLVGGVPYPCMFGTLTDPTSLADGFLVGAVMTGSDKAVCE